MIKGIVYALTACFFWGLIFVIPQYLEEFSALEVTLGRYLFYGMVSLLFFFVAFVQGRCRYPAHIWFKALMYSVSCTIGYYTFVVMALRYASPAICALILGIAPITIAFYGNWKERECTYRSLLIPSMLILLGLVIINVPHFTESTSPWTHLFGIGCSFAALLCWTWYAVTNARFLKDHPEVNGSDWATLFGVTSLVWVALFGLISCFFFSETLGLQRYVIDRDAIIRFVIGCTVLGLLCSWVGGYLWNRASVYLPVSFAGQLTIFETIFGLIFVYTINQTLPHAYEFWFLGRIGGGLSEVLP